MPELALVRRFEAAGFRAWPAASAHYDGTWLTRLTPAHPAKRLNSVNPLDPGDCLNLDGRISRARSAFEQAGRPFTFRMSPLSGRVLAAHFDAAGWDAFGHSLVLRMPLDGPAVDDGISHIPLKDVARFTASRVEMDGDEAGPAAGLEKVITAIPAEAGLFVLERDNRPIATAVCVHDGDLAGLFEVATDKAERGKGFGRRIVLSALKWARSRGAHQAWLQVEAGNEAALKLYPALGFTELYRYHYRRPVSA